MKMPAIRIWRAFSFDESFQILSMNYFTITSHWLHIHFTINFTLTSLYTSHSLHYETSLTSPMRDFRPHRETYQSGVRFLYHPFYTIKRTVQKHRWVSVSVSHVSRKGSAARLHYKIYRPMGNPPPFEPSAPCHAVACPLWYCVPPFPLFERAQ